MMDLPLDDGIRVVPGDVLKKVCQQERQHGLNRQHDIEFEEALDDDIYYPVAFHMPHHHRAGVNVADTLPHYRTVVIVADNKSGANIRQVQFDILAEVFNKLPTLEEVIERADNG